MLHQISSSMPTFKTLDFHDGLNILVADRPSNARRGETRNRSGKTSFVELVHFLLGEQARPKSSIFRHDPLKDHSFRLDFDLGQERLIVERSGGSSSDIRVARHQRVPEHGLVDARRARWLMANEEWKAKLGREMFGLAPDGANAPRRDREPSFRMLFPYFARRERGGGFRNPTKAGDEQNEGDRQVSLTYLFGLEWRIARLWQDVRDRENAMKAIKKVSDIGSDLPFVKRAEVLEPKLRSVQQRVENLRHDLASRTVHPEYQRLREDADTLTTQISALLQQDLTDESILRDIELTIGDESPSSRRDLLRLYEEVGVIFPAAV